MQSMQSKMLAEFDRLITSHDLEAVEVREHANTGHVHAQRGFRTLLDIDYSFQTSNCTIKITGPILNRLVEQGLTGDNPPQFRITTKSGTSEMAWWVLSYGTERVDQMFGTVNDLLGYAATL